MSVAAGQRASPLIRRLLELLAALVGASVVVATATIPLDGRGQAIFTVAVMLMFLVLNRSANRGMTLVLIMISVTMTLRYIFWRATETMRFDSSVEFILGSGLLLAELYAAMVLVFGYIQNISPIHRQPMPLPLDDGTWPTVDIYIPSYNEPLEIVRATVLSALAIDWPRDKLKVYLLDDGRRPDFKVFAEQCGCGYITRQDNAHAKAGNLNHAMSLTSGEFIAVFDCDHVPTRSFLQLTMGWLVAEANMAMVQTPHHFYSPDPYQRNLAAGTRVPAEGNLFYGLIQDGNDYWNACFFCGSCAVIRRSALDEIGGFAVETVTEDAHTMLKLHRHGWESAYLRIPLAAGLATERLRQHIRQRVRWARGMIQILRLDNPLFGPGLTFGQRICYLQASSHFLYALPRICFLTAPLAYLLAGQSVIAASPLAITAYALPHIILSTATNSRMQRNWRHSFWSEVYETVLALSLVRVTVVTLLTPRRGKFDVTAKGGVLETGYFDIAAVYPNLILAILLTAGIARGIIGMTLFEQSTMVFQALLLNSIWGTFSLLTVMAALAVGRETRQVRHRPRINAEVPVVVRLGNGAFFKGTSVDLSQGGALLAVKDTSPIRAGASLEIMFMLEKELVSVQAQALHAEDGFLALRWIVATLQDEANVVRCVFGRADAWVDWDSFPVDHPLRSLWNVLVSIGGLFRSQAVMPVPVERVEPAVSLPAPQNGNGNGNGNGRAKTRIAQTTVAASLVLVMVMISTVAMAAQLMVRAAPPSGTPAALPSGIGTGGQLFDATGPATVTTRPGAPTTAPSPTDAAAPSSSPNAATAPATDEGTQAGVRTVVYTLRQLGANGPMTLRGTSELAGLQFGIRADEVVTSAELELTGAMSPALIPEFSNITVTLNELYVGTIPVSREHQEYQLTLPVSPMFFVADDNRLNFRFTGRYTRDCNDPLSGLLWGSVYDNSALTLRLERLPARRALGRLPLPFFDQHERDRLVLPFVLPAEPRDETLKAAAVLASWFGAQAAYRGASFPVLTEPPPDGNAVVVTTGDGPEAASIGLPPLTGPTLAVLANPNDPYGSLLVIAGRTPQETQTAALALAVSNRAFGAVSLATVQAPELARRVPYDAPNWIPSDRPVKLGEIVDQSSLRNYGYVGLLHVPFQTSPDFFTWGDRSFPLDLIIHAPPGPIIDVAPSRLDIGINGFYLASRSLAPAQWDWGYLGRLLGRKNARPDTIVGIPPYSVFGQNDLQLFFDSRPLHRGDCVAVPNDLRMSVDPESTIDLSRGYHVSRLPNLGFFAGSGFPFSRMADLSQTAAVLPDQPSNVEISAFLMLMGRFGALTGYPVTGMTVVRPEAVDSVASRDLLMMGTIDHLGNVGDLLAQAGVRPVNGRLVVLTSSSLSAVHRLFEGERDADRDHAASVLATNQTDDWGALIGMESPRASGRSLIALLATTPQTLESMILAFGDPEQAPLIQGDLTLFTGTRPTSYRIGSTFTFGDLPFWLWPSWYLGDRPTVIALLILLGCAILGVPLYRAIGRTRDLRRGNSRVST